MSQKRYNHINCRKTEGAHYTPEILSDFVAKSIVSEASLQKSIKIVDPAIGDGELIISLLRCLQKVSSNIEVFGFDTNIISLEITSKRLLKEFPNIQPKLYQRDFLQVCLEKDSLFQGIEIPDFDLLISNPPYIRTQVLGAKQAQLISRKFGLKGRVDIYQAFLVAMKSVLASTGVAGVIVSNRFISTKGSATLRKILLDHYDIRHLWDFGDTKLFEAAVLPAVMVMKHKKSKGQTETLYTSIYVNNSNEEGISNVVANNPIEAIRYTGIVSGQKGIKYIVKHGYLSYDSFSCDVWRLQDNAIKKWLREVEKNTWATFRDIGKVRVGVKTTADNVFIRSDWKKEIGYEPELILPLTTHHVAGRFKKNNMPFKFILYTHKMENGKRKVHDLDSHPSTKKYLKENYEQLSGRKYVIEANRHWFEIWVPQNPSLWERPKIIFRDISEKPTFWMDLSKTVVNGDCYWMISDHDNLPNEILWLVLAVANSEFIENYYDIKFQNKLYSNRRRFMTQYVEKFPIPDPDTRISRELVKLSHQIYDDTKEDSYIELEQRINQLVWKAFAVSKIGETMD